MITNYDNVVTKYEIYYEQRWPVASELVPFHSCLKGYESCGSFFFLGSKSASADWSSNNKRDVASRRKLAPRRLGRVVLDSIPGSPEFESHSQQFEIQDHAL